MISCGFAMNFCRITEISARSSSTDTRSDPNRKICPIALVSILAPTGQDA